MIEKQIKITQEENELFRLLFAEGFTKTEERYNSCVHTFLTFRSQEQTLFMDISPSYYPTRRSNELDSIYLSYFNFLKMSTENLLSFVLFSWQEV